MKALVVAGTHSGCGKTSLALGLMAAFRRRGLVVQPFKVGPDFIDPGHHELAAGRASENLDGWMLGREGVLRVVSTALRQAPAPDLALIEGVMGLFDGANATDEQGSTAQLAKWLGAPVLLVVDARSMARSAAALVQGFARFDPELRFAGVAFNRVGSENHRSLLAEALQNCPEIELAGFLARDAGLELPSRHLGLVTAQDQPLSAELRARLADWAEDGLDLDLLYARLPELEVPSCPDPQAPPPLKGSRIGVATDKAFCFYYPDNLRWLARFGAELVPFSPLSDRALPVGCQGLYLGGGYPELYAEELAANEPLRAEIRDFCRDGRPAYAECGGFMYLLRGLETGQVFFPFVGAFDAECRMAGRLSGLGYREVELAEDCPLGAAGAVIRGHEFHYSRLAAPGLDGKARPVYIMRDRKGRTLAPEGYALGNTLGSYVHLHFGSNPDAARAFTALCGHQGGAS
jgi:cobyrinic acid a,c-diamide synthase